jgi:flagellar biosynthesis protein FlhF
MNHNCHTFEADNIVDALTQVRTSLGPEAVILDTRRVKPFPLWGREKVRVTAERHDSPQQRIELMYAELRKLRGEVGQMARGAAAQHRPVPAPRNPALEAAAAGGLSEAGCKRLSGLLDGKTPSRAELAALLRREIRTADIADAPGLTMLVGTTGVGKTTTLAKLAAPLAVSGKSAALISKDAFRIGAMDQLRTYADLLGMPFESAFRPEELLEAARRHADKYAVLIDTAGHGPYNAGKLEELRLAAEALPGCRVILTVSLAQARDARRIAHSFRALRPRALIVTKLDETDMSWGLLDILRETGLPLAFTTSGQNVPDDIARADAGTLADTLLATVEGIE